MLHCWGAAVISLILMRMRNLTLLILIDKLCPVRY